MVSTYFLALLFALEALLQSDNCYACDDRTRTDHTTRRSFNGADDQAEPRRGSVTQSRNRGWHLRINRTSRSLCGAVANSDLSSKGEVAHLALIAKSIRHSRQYRKFAEMYWALAPGTNVIASSLKTEPQKEHDMTIYPVEFQRRLEQKWARRIDQIIAVTGNATPPRDPKEDDDYEDEGEEKARRCQYGYQA